MQHPTAIRLAAYADGELEGSEARKLELHLRRCPQCQAELAELRALSTRLQEFALPDSLGVDLWERVEQRLPELQRASQPASNGLWRWVATAGLVAANAVLQAALIVALGLWVLSSLGLLDWQALAPAWLRPATQFPTLSLEEVSSYLLSWLAGVPVGLGLEALMQRWDVEVIFDLISWLLPSALALLPFVGLVLVYVLWLLAHFRHRASST